MTKYLIALVINRCRRKARDTPMCPFQPKSLGSRI